MKKQVITNKNVSTTFDKVPCRLLREIVAYNGKDLGVTKYIIQTKQVIFEDYEVPTYDEEGNPIVDENGNPIMETKQRLVVLATIQKDGVLVATKEVSDRLYEYIKDQIEIGDSFFDYNQKVEQLALLLETQSIAPYNTVAEDWEVYED